MLAKGRAVVTKGPAALRNFVYGKLGIWPVGRLDDDKLRTLPVYCISLKRAAERRSLMQRQVEALGFARFEFVEAVEAEGLDYEALAASGLYDDAAARRFHGRSLRLTEVAGSLSHVKVYEQIATRSDPMALVLEDDALFLSRQVNRFRLDSIPADAEVVFLNSFRDNGDPQDKIDGNLFGTASYTGSAAAYLLSRSGAAKLVRAGRPIVHAADGLIGRVLPKPSGVDNVRTFHQVGVTTELQGYMIYPDCVLNGSVCHYFGSYIPTGKNRAA